MITKLKFILTGFIILIFAACNMDGDDTELDSAYTGTWIAQSYDTAGTANDYVLANLTSDINENKTYRFIISKSSFTQYNKAGTLKIKCSIEPDSESSFDFTVTDPGLDTMEEGATAYYDIVETATSEIILNAYWDSSKSSGIIASYHLLPE